MGLAQRIVFGTLLLTGCVIGLVQNPASVEGWLGTVIVVLVGLFAH